MKAKKMLIIYLLLVWPIIMVSLFLIVTERVSIFYSGFAVDSSDVLYIGKDARIEKYYDGRMIGKISPKTSRGYAFTIQKDDTILLSTSSFVYNLDLSGNVIDTWEDIDTKTFNSLQGSKNTFTSQTGREYVMKSHFGRYVIYSDGNIIYQMPLMEYAVKIAFATASFSIFVFVPIIIKKWRKEHNHSQMSPVSIM